MKTLRSWLSLLAGPVGCALVLAAGASGQTDPRFRPGSLPSYLEGWKTPADNLLAFAVDAQDRVWLLTRDAAFVRLDEQGKITERIPFAWPADLQPNNAFDRPFLIAGDDFVVGRYRYDRAGQVVALYPFPQSRFLAAGPDGTVVRLHEGLEIYDRKGRLVRRFSEGGLAPGKLTTPTGLAVDRRGRIYVAELQRLQLFDRQGALVRAVELPAELRPHGILGLALDGDGFLYAPIAHQGAAVAVFDPELRYLGSLRTGWERHPWNLTADRQGRLYALVTSPGRFLRQAVPAAGSPRLAKPLPATGGELPRELPKALPAQEIPVAVTVEDRPSLPFRLHASTRGILHAAADPLVPGRLWLGTEGGLVRFDSGSGAWHRWTVADGLPEQEVRSVWSDGRRVYLLMRDSAAVFEIEPGRFRSFALQGKGLSSLHLAGVRVVPAPDDPGLLWWFVESGVFRHELAGGSWSFFPAPGPQPVRDGLALGGGRVVVLSPAEVWELRPDTKQWRRVCDIDALDRVAPARRDPARKLELRSIAADDGGRTFWIGTWGEGLFRVEADSGKAAWPEETRDPRCGLQRVVRQGDRLFAFGAGCLREIGRPGCCTVDAGQVEEIRQAAPDPASEAKDRLWLATRRGLASLRPADGHLTFHLPPWSEPDGVKVEALLAAEGRLWISQREGGVSAFDPAAESWTTFPRLRQVRVLRRSAANGHLLVYGYGGRGRALTWIDPKTAEQALVPGRWEEDPWGAVHDLHHDARGLWAVGNLRSRSGRGFGVQRADGTSQILLEGQLSSGPHTLTPDPAHPGDFLLVGENEELLRLQSGTGRAETLRSKARQIRLAHERFLWIQGEPSARLDLRTGTVVTLALEGRIFPDPLHPDRGWLIRQNVLSLEDVVRRERLREITLPRGQIYEEVALLEDRLWIGSSLGLLEIPLAP